MSPKTGYLPVLNCGLRIFFAEFVRVSLPHPCQALFYGRTVLWQLDAMRRRAAAERAGLRTISLGGPPSLKPGKSRTTFKRL